MPRFVRSLLPLLLLTAPAFPAILPETIGHWQRGEPTTVVIPDQKLWVEYGLLDAESSPYSDAGKKYTIEAYRFGDGTGAMAAWDAIRPATAKPAALMGLAVQTDADEYVAAGNYLFVFKGYKILPEELSHVVATVPHYGHSPLPTLPKYLPTGFVVNSERYIMGPEGLVKYAPMVSPSTAGFSFSAEGILAKYELKGKTSTLLLFSYPTMEMARDRLPQFQKIPGTVVKRTGPLLAIALNPANADDAERLLSQVKYQAEVTIPQRPPSPKDNPGNLFLNIAILVLVLAGFCVLSGVVVGGFRILMRRGGGDGEGDQMISLHLTGRQ